MTFRNLSSWIPGFTVWRRSHDGQHGHYGVFALPSFTPFQSSIFPRAMTYFSVLFTLAVILALGPTSRTERPEMREANCCMEALVSRMRRRLLRIRWISLSLILVCLEGPPGYIPHDFTLRRMQAQDARALGGGRAECEEAHKSHETRTDLGEGTREAGSSGVDNAGRGGRVPKEKQPARPRQGRPDLYHEGGATAPGGRHSDDVPIREMKEPPSLSVLMTVAVCFWFLVC